MAKRRRHGGIALRLPPSPAIVEEEGPALHTRARQPLPEFSLEEIEQFLRQADPDYTEPISVQTTSTEKSERCALALLSPSQ